MIKSILSLLATPVVIATLGATMAQAAPQYPFPQQVKYQYGNTATYVDPSVIQSHFNDWKAARFIDNGDGTARVMSPNDSAEISVSEGIAYGMMLMVYMSSSQKDYQSEFDKLWAYWKKYAVNAGSASGMNWHINNKNSSVGSGSATDADIDAAFALIMASKQWNNATYLSEAKTLINWMKSKDMESDGRVKAGSNWNPALNPSYVIPAAFKLFAEVTGDSFWETAITTNLKHLSQCQNATSGLMPDWCDWSSHKATDNTGAAVSGGKGGFFDDAARTPWRMAMAYNWYGIKEAKAVNDKIVPWLDKSTYGDANMIWPGYSLDGASCPYAFFTTSTFVGIGLAMSSADNPKYYLESVYTVLSNTEGAKAPNSTKGEKYYPATLNILYLLAMSGNMPNFYDMSGLEKYTMTSVRQPQAPAGGVLQPVNSGAHVGGYENWGTFADKYGVTVMVPDSGSSGLYQTSDGIIVSAQMRIAPEPTYEAGVDLVYPFAGIALSFDKQDGYYDLSNLAAIKLTYKSQGVIRLAILDKATLDDGNEGGESGFFLHPADEWTTTSIGMTDSDFGSSYEEYLDDKIVPPSWIVGGNARSTILQAVRGFKFEPKMSKGGFGHISISAMELLDAQGNVIADFTNGIKNLKPAKTAQNASIQGKNLVYNNMGKNARLDLFDMNGNRISSMKLQKAGSVAIESLLPAKGQFVACIRSGSYKQVLRIHK